MKINEPITNREKLMQDGTILVSKTDLKGAITSCNQDFIDMSGFSEEELIGKNHNMVRHPFMPAAAFKDLWATGKSGRPWSGVIKNRCKNGDHYWVLGNVTPLWNNGELEGYMSVRTKPTREQVSQAEQLYSEINASADPERFFRTPSGWLQKFGISSFSARQKLTLGIAVLTQILLVAFVIAGINLPAILATLVVGATLTLFSGLKQLKEITETVAYAAGKLQEIGEGNYFSWTEVGRRDELGTLLDSVKMAQIKLGFDVINANETVLRIIGLNSELDLVATGFQRSATSIDESAANITEINNTVKNNAVNTQDADNLAGSAKDKAENSGQRLKEALEAMEKINQASVEISKIIRLIDEIAFKTKLLSINASVEAAHAGDQGKGFSVVADEVRSLAAHTASAASEIKQLIDDSQHRIVSGQEKMKNSDEALSSVISEVNKVSELLSEIACAGKEQAVGVENLSSTMQVINDSIQKNTELVTKTTNTSRKLGDHAEEVMRNSGMAVS